MNFRQWKVPQIFPSHKKWKKMGWLRFLLAPAAARKTIKRKKWTAWQNCPYSLHHRLSHPCKYSVNMGKVCCPPKGKNMNGENRVRECPLLYIWHDSINARHGRTIWIFQPLLNSNPVFLGKGNAQLTVLSLRELRKFKVIYLVDKMMKKSWAIA